jgi:hypothetical protein
MSPLHSRLASLRHRLRFVVTVRGGCAAAAVLLVCVCVAGLFDFGVYRVLKVETWSLLRAAFLVGTLILTGGVAYWFLWRPLSLRTDDLSLALRVEQQYPVLNDALASTVQFLEQQAQGKTAVSPALQKEAVQRALRLAQGCDFHKAIDARGLVWSVVSLMLAVLLGLVLFVVVVLPNPAQGRTALARIADPFGDHPWQATAALTRLEVNAPHFLAYGQPLVVSGTVRGPVLEEKQPQVSIEFDSPSLQGRAADIREKWTGTGKFTFNIKLENPPPEIRFRIRCGDAVSPPQAGAWHTVALKQPPQMVALGGKASPQITLRPPRYADLPEQSELTPGTGSIEVLAGTHVTLRAAADRPIARVWVEFQPAVTEQNIALALAGLGPRHPLDAVITAGLTYYGAWGKIPGTVEKDGTEFSVRFLPWLTGAYTVTLQDKDGLAKSYSFDQIVEADPVPTVDFLRPSSSQSVLANADVNLEILARDEKFALKSLWLEYRRKDRQGKWIDAEPKKLIFYDHEKVGAALPVLLASLHPVPLFRVPEPMRLRPKMLLATKRWSLKGLAIEGETLVIQACAEDFCDVVPSRQPGRSIELELKVVGKTALSGVIAEAEAKIQDELLRLREMQDRAIKKVIAAEQQWRASGKLRPEDLLELAEAELLQKEIEARIGMRRDEGLRDEIARVEQMIKDNKMPRSEAGDRLRLLREALEKLSKENLPKIAPSLDKAQRELAAPDPVDIPSPKERGDLGTARGEQEKVYQTLDELLAFMEERASLAQIKAELRAILKEQQDRRQEVEELVDAVLKANNKAIKDNPAAIDKIKDWEIKADVLKNAQLKANLRKTAELQRRLGDRTEKVIGRMEQVRDKMRDVDDELAEMLNKALKLALEPREFQNLPKEMRSCAELLHDQFDTPAPKAGKKTWWPQVLRVRKQQGNSIQCLEEMLQALEQSREAEIEKLVSRQKKEGKAIDDIAAKMAKLQEEIDAAKKIQDPDARAEALKKLADKQRALALEAEKKARELERLLAPEAAAPLAEAAKKMTRAAMELDDGKAPDEQLKQARQDLDQAREGLKDDQDAAREELTRENIAKIVDRLQGLKERQDAAIVESERLHKLVLQSSGWPRKLCQTLADDMEAQTGIAKETGLLRDKLKGAKVYHMVLEEAGKAMEAAAKRMEDQQKFAVPLQDQKGLDEKQLAEDARLFKEAVKYQKDASEYLEHLIEALLPELEPPPQPKDDGGGGGGGAGQQPKGGLKAQDGIPLVAQLKVLKAQQMAVNTRTKEFAELHPDLTQLTPEQRAELDAIHVRQERLLELFREMVTSANEGGKQQ